MTWIRTIIIDRSIKRIKTHNEVEMAQVKISYAFAGFHPDTKIPEWCTRGEHVKLYENVSDAVTDAKILQEELPVDVLTYTITPEQKLVQITLVKF